jgi:hypothetical protein
MLTALFTILLIYVVWKLIKLAILATWGIAKVIVCIVLFPIVLIGLVIGGLIYVALPLLIVIGIIAILSGN